MAERTKATRRVQFEDRMRLTDEERARIDARQRDPNWQPSPVDWLDMPPDPFGMDWKWATSGDPKARAVGFPMHEGGNKRRHPARPKRKLRPKLGVKPKLI